MATFIHPDDIRGLFSKAMSNMYRAEVPLYGELIELVQDVNEDYLAANPQERQRLAATGELARLDVERHGAIRVGTAHELAIIRRMFGLMGMLPVGYYDLSVAGIPVHSTAFRPVDHASLQKNPFRIFTSLLRLDLLKDPELASIAEEILSKRQIVTDRAIELIELAENRGGLSVAEAEEFVTEALETFHWHNSAVVDAATYKRLHDAHRLVADVVSFRGPHINHLTPRSLDIDTVQREMPKRNITPKAIIEGPPRRKMPILLRQTSFMALEEEVRFDETLGTHTARFGEIEQRGAALTPKGRAGYDDALARSRAEASVDANGAGAADYMEVLEAQFSTFADDFNSLRQQKLVFLRYDAVTKTALPNLADNLDALLLEGHLMVTPQTYEDFLPVSAAGIFQSNLGEDGQSDYSASANQTAFEQALGRPVLDEMALYAATERETLRVALQSLGQMHLLQDKTA